MSVNTFLTAVADYLALISARYQKYRADETAKSRAQAQQAQINAAIPFYTEYAKILVECVANNYSSCGLSRPGALPQHLLPYGTGVGYIAGVGICYAYVFDRGSSFCGGLNGQIQYNTTPAKQMSERINMVLPNFCIANGAAPVQIVKSKDLNAGRVCFVIAPLPGIMI